MPTPQEWLDLGGDIGWRSGNFESFGFTNFQNVFWSETEFSSSGAFVVGLSAGGSYVVAKTSPAYVACVRRN